MSLLYQTLFIHDSPAQHTQIVFFMDISHRMVYTDGILIGYVCPSVRGPFNYKNRPFFVMTRSSAPGALILGW